MATFDKIKKVASKLNSPILETYIPVSSGERDFWNLHKNVNQHLTIDPKSVTPENAQDHIFKGTTTPESGHRPADKENKFAADNPTKQNIIEPTVQRVTVDDDTKVDAGERETVSEEKDPAIARLMVQRAKAKKQLKQEPHNTALQAKLASVNARIKNLQAGANARDTWAKNAEASHKGNDDEDTK